MDKKSYTSVDWFIGRRYGSKLEGEKIVTVTSQVCLYLDISYMYQFLDGGM